MVRGMLPDKIDNGHLCPACIVQIRETVGETGTEMQDGARRLFRHARITVRSSSHNSFEEAEHAAHFRQPVERSNQMNLRSARVCKTGVNTAGGQRAN